jgi:hypothetical protein
VTGGPAGAPLRRRALLRAGLLGAAAAAAGGATAAAQAKVTMAAAGYQGSPKGGFSCEVCSLFRPPHGCVVVAGDISPHGWCKFFALPD